MTLDEMFIECALYTDETITKTNGSYTGTSLSTVNKFKTGINYAYKKIASEKWMPRHSENVVLDSDLRFDVSDLAKSYNGTIKVLNSDGNEIYFEEIDDSFVECWNEEEGDTVTVYYFYIPDELSDLDDEPVFPVRAVDHKILCQFGAYMFFNIDNDTKADIWLNLFNDGFASISQSPGAIAKETWG